MANSGPQTPRKLLFPETMARVDTRTIASGTPGIVLMERAGAGVVRVIRGRWTRRPVLVLAGPGNNGGDGWVIARRLKELGWPVAVHSDWPREKLSGDAKLAAGAAGIMPLPLGAASFSSDMLVVDALFGAGLVRAIEGTAAAVLARVVESGAGLVAVDLPSGLCGKTGAVLGRAARADATVTFGAAKPGHFLGEGRALSGALHLCDIGLDIQPTDADAYWNSPALWRKALPLPPHAAHKYARGGVLVVGGARHQGGAARLAAHAAAAAGAGAVTVAVSPGAADIYAARLDAIMLRTIKAPGDLKRLIEDPKIHAVVIGPGLSTDEGAGTLLDEALAAGKPLLLDADALTLMAGRADRQAAIPEGSVLTPHEGEFARVFPEADGSALERALDATRRTRCTVLLKGAASIITCPDRIAVINTHASPFLATAGSGDVLAGIIAALLAQGVAPGEAAAAGAFIHGDTGLRNSAGLTADTLWQNIGAALHAMGAATGK